MAEEQAESQFFEKPKADTGTGLFKPYKTMPIQAKIGIVAALMLVVGGIIYLIPKAQDATLWVINPGPAPVHLEVAGQGHDLDAGKLLDTIVKVEEEFEIGAFRGEEAEDIKLKLMPNKEGVSIVDLGGDGAYVVLDVSQAYAGEEPPKLYKIVHISQPAKVHTLPYQALKLVRPGRDIPPKGSWEMKASQGAKGTLELFKVARVNASRLADEAALAASLSEAINSKSVSDYENMRAFVNTAKPGTHDGVIPALK